MHWTRRAARVAILVAIVVGSLGTLASAGLAGEAGWRMASQCRAPNGDGVIQVTNPLAEVANATLRRASDGFAVGAALLPGSSAVVVPWGSASDHWRLLVNEVEATAVTIGNEWCVDTEVRAERLRHACDEGVETLVGYDVVDNFEGIEMIATPARGGAGSLPAEVTFTLTPGTYASSMAPSAFTVYDGGSFHFGATIRYDAQPLDCSSPDAPQVEDEPDVFALLDDVLGLDSTDGVMTEAPVEPSPIDSPPSEPVTVDAPVAPSTAAPVARASASRDTLPVTGASTPVLVAVAGFLLFVGALLTRAGRQSAHPVGYPGR